MRTSTAGRWAVIGVIIFAYSLMTGLLYGIAASISSLIGATVGAILLYSSYRYVRRWSLQRHAARNARLASEAQRNADVERAAQMVASRERHLAHRSQWLLEARRSLKGAPPSWTAQERDAFAWLYPRLGRELQLRRREEGHERRYQYGERNASDWEELPTRDWASQPVRLSLPDDALRPAERHGVLDERIVDIDWEVLTGFSLPARHCSVTKIKDGVEFRKGHSYNDVNDYDHGYFGTYVEVMQIVDSD